MESPAQNRVIVALDFDNSRDALHLVDSLDPRECKLKVGKELFTRAGPELVRALISREFPVFLDLKFHDIPATVAGAVMAAADMGVWMANVHALGGNRMMAAAGQALLASGSDMLLIAVTLLTSMEQSDCEEVGLPADVDAEVIRLANLAQQCGMDGVVCSARETLVLRNRLGDDFLLVTPGIRPPDSATDDQRRVVTPRHAVESGSDFLVIGRPITRASDPLASLRAINASIAGLQQSQ